ncbi:AAA family ATPase [Bradyrhizobium sp.]|uniref:AAA family ATPase n=1 Tax=Bradyrhizobium sp. TaxID=376 RepID=UPI0039E53D0E
MQTSLLRTVSRRDVLDSFPRILRGDSQLTPYEFVFKFSTGYSELPEQCEFAVRPDSRPPTNVHVLIGRNGVGKTRLLAGMADALTENKLGSIGVSGQFEFTDKSNEFLNLIVVSYSAFDRFDPITADRRRSDSSIPYHYIGIKKHIEVANRVGVIEEQVALKTADDFYQEFSGIFGTLTNKAPPRFNEQRYQRWIKALNVLRSDPGLADFIDDPSGGRRSLVEIFPDLSSGHKIVLLTIARLVENVSDRSLVIIDEPETHLHPPLLGSLIRAISELLISQNGVAIIATHSPVVLQEVPARCVSVISRTGERIRIRRPKTETFAENVGMLTRKVFGLEVSRSGFYRLLKEAAKGGDFDIVIKEFGDEIGGEGRALARVFTSEDEEE